MPRGFSGLISALCLPDKKNFVNSGKLERHCSPEFMKHVLPKLLKPTSPARDFLVR